MEEKRLGPTKKNLRHTGKKTKRRSQEEGGGKDSPFLKEKKEPLKNRRLIKKLTHAPKKKT